ncbi:aminoglycoside phosphotransferase [Pseudonocardia sp. MH-G8]|uniref:aminoglycoside phosphotransferase n=1 Tax=Pseudonocardia sp. MH-G8 TaxID=1854588 RepID=UPI000B9FA7CB|nr:aminoglycoside phosphotransferase [Pseudonocardia sp. MH-G8]OZM80346.1 aminoglycoside phosphotransferase [Pseudonocardia sp. MH-G8]
MPICDEIGADDVRARKERAVTAAAEAGRALGLTVTEPHALYDVFSVVVHLRPAPVVVRVPTVLPRTVAADPVTQADQQRRELAAAGWLAAQGHPVVPPSPLVPAEPVRHDGYSMTFWQYVEQVPGESTTGLDEPERLRLAAQLHAALRDHPGELRFLMPLDASVPDGLAQLESRPDLLAPADLDRARAEWTLIEPLTDPGVFAATFPGRSVQPVHGDAPTYNLIVTPDGPLASDFEHVTRGPVEWDMVYADDAARAVYDAAATERGLRPLDERLLQVMETARMLQLIACLPMARELPGLRDGVTPAIDHWRAGPPLEL